LWWLLGLYTGLRNIARQGDVLVVVRSREDHPAREGQKIKEPFTEEEAVM